MMCDIHTGEFDCTGNRRETEEVISRTHPRFATVTDAIAYTLMEAGYDDPIALTPARHFVVSGLRSGRTQLLRTLAAVHQEADDAP